MALKDNFVQGPTPPPGGYPQKPENYDAGVGSHYVGEIPGWEYSPYDDLYHPPGKKEDDGKQSIGEYLIPVAGAAGTYALVKGVAESPTAFFKGVSDFVASGYDKIKSWFTGTPTPTPSVPTVKPTTTTGPGVTPNVAPPTTGSSPTFGLGAETPNVDLGTSAPFSWGGETPSAPTGAPVGGPPSTPTGIEAQIGGPTPPYAEGGAAPGTPEVVEVGGKPVDGAGETSWGDYAKWLAMAYDVYQGVSSWDDWSKKGDDYAATREQQQIARTVGDYFTGGLAGLADSGVRAVAPHFMNEVDEFATEYGPMGILTRALGSKKDKDQQARDDIRQRNRKFEITDKDHMIQNVDGGLFNLGADGGATLPGGEMEGDQRHYYDVNFKDPNAAKYVPPAQILAALVTGGDGKLKDDWTGEFVNAATSSGDPEANLKSYYQKYGFDHQTAYDMIGKLQEAGRIDQDKADAYRNGLDEFFHVNAYANPNQAPSVAPSYVPGGQQNQPGGVPAPTVTPVATPQVTPPQIAPRPAPFSMGAPGQQQTNPQQAAAWQGLVNDTTATSQGQPAPRNTAPVRVSPGVWHDDKGTYYSKTGQRGQ